MVFPLGSHLADVPQAGRRRRQRLHVPRVRPQAVRGAGAALPAGADRPAQHDQVPAQARRAARASTPSRSSSARSTPRSSRSGTCGARSRRTSSAPPASRSSPTRPTRAASATSSKTRWACPARSPFARQRRRQARQRRRCARLIATTPPLVLFGSYNERMYLAETRRRAAIYIPASLPRRDHPPPHRHAVHGLCRRDLPGAGSLQRAVRRAVPHPAAGAPTWTGSRPTPARARARAGAGTTTPSAMLDALVEAEPVLVRISAAKRLRDAAERDARARRRGPRHRASASRWRLMRRSARA